jgi:hypothetical protein
MIDKNKTCDIWASMISVYPGTHLYRYAVEEGIITDELEYLEKGCPLINVSRLTDEQFMLIIDKAKNHNLAKELLYKSHLSKGREEFSLKKDGSIVYTGYCPRCFTKVVNQNLKNTAEYHRCYTGCPECNNRLSFFGSKAFERANATDMIKDGDFTQYAGKGIAIWGINSPLIREMLFISQTLRDCIVKIVDPDHGNYESESYCGQRVEPVSALKAATFDYVMIGPETANDTVVLQLRDMGIDAPVIKLSFTCTPGVT